MASLSEGFCPDCQTATMEPHERTLADWEGTEKTARVLVCSGCGGDWWPAELVRPGESGWSGIGTEDSVRQLLSARTFDGRWRPRA